MTARALMLAAGLVALSLLFSALAGCGGGAEEDTEAAYEACAAQFVGPLLPGQRAPGCEQAAGHVTLQPVACNASGVCR